MVEIKKGHLLKAVLFDMDGVLFDSMKNHTLAWYRALSSRGVKRLDTRAVEKDTVLKWSQLVGESRGDIKVI